MKRESCWPRIRIKEEEGEDEEDEGKRAKVLARKNCWNENFLLC